MEAASKTAAFLRREFGLSPDDAEGEMHGEVLTICLPRALSPLGRVLARTPEGVEALETVYALLHEAHQRSLEAQISRIAGMKAGQSRVELDCRSGDVRVRFRLPAQAEKEDYQCRMVCFLGALCYFSRWPGAWPMAVRGFKEKMQCCLITGWPGRRRWACLAT